MYVGFLGSLFLVSDCGRFVGKGTQASKPAFSTRKKRMKSTATMLLTLLLSASPVVAGEVFGTITDGSKPVAAGVKVDIAVSGKTYTAETDKFGSYRIVVKEKGKCKLTVHISEQSPSVDLFSYDRSTRYDWILGTKDGKLFLRRK
jgi:hypothetical protein